MNLQDQLIKDAEAGAEDARPVVTAADSGAHSSVDIFEPPSACGMFIYVFQTLVLLMLIMLQLFSTQSLDSNHELCAGPKPSSLHHTFITRLNYKVITECIYSLDSNHELCAGPKPSSSP